MTRRKTRLVSAAILGVLMALMIVPAAFSGGGRETTVEERPMVLWLPSVVLAR